VEKDEMLNKYTFQGTHSMKFILVKPKILSMAFDQYNHFQMANSRRTSGLRIHGIPLL